jgi:hypothetical protein
MCIRKELSPEELRQRDSALDFVGITWDEMKEALHPFAFHYSSRLTFNEEVQRENALRKKEWKLLLMIESLKDRPFNEKKNPFLSNGRYKLIN